MAADTRGPARVVRRAMLVYCLLGVVVLLVSGVDTYIAARAVARADALREAEQTGAAFADLMVRPFLLDVQRGDDAVRIDELDRAVDARIRDGSLVRLRVLRPDGEVLYAEAPDLIGRYLPLPGNAAKALAEDAPAARICHDVHDGPNNTSTCSPTPLVEVAVPLQLTAEARLVVQAYFSYDSVQARTVRLTRALVLLIVIVLLALQVAQVPITYSLARSVTRHQEERRQLLERALGASEHERRRIARELHDGVIQDLAGSSYVLAAVEKSSLPDHQRRMVGKAAVAIQDAVYALRAVMVDIYPPDLTEGGLAKAIDDLAEPLRDDGLDVRLDIDTPVGASAATVATLYRLAREAFSNIAAHAQAGRVDVALRREPDHVTLRVEDDGVGLPGAGIDRRAEGHLGLRLIADAVAELGGVFRAVNRPTGGTSIQVRIPLVEDVPITATGEESDRWHSGSVAEPVRSAARWVRERARR